MQNKTKTYAILIFIVALGFFLRVYNIENAPPGVYPDEAVNGIDAATANDTGEYQWFYPANNGREGLFMNLIAFCFKLFGISVFALKLPSIIFGTLAIWGIYLLAKELFDSRKMGLLSSFPIAVSFWAINFSRISFRAIMVPALLVFSFYFLFKGLRTRKWFDFAAGGFIFGLGLHTYIAWRVTPLILLAMLFILMISQKDFLKTFWKSIFIFTAFALISAGPMFWDFFVTHPEHWESRTGSISILNPEVNQGRLASTFLKTLGLSLAKYNFWGDQNWRHNFPPYAILDPLTGIAFLFGFVYSIIRLFHLLTLRFIKREFYPRLPTYAFLVFGFLIMLIPEFMAMEGTPHALRAIGTMPFAFIFAALTFDFFLKKIKRHNPIFQKLAVFLIILALASIGIFNSIKYHLVWAKKIETARSFEKTVMNMEKYIKTLPTGKEIFVVADNMQRIPPRLFSWGNPLFYDLHPIEIGNIQPKEPDNFTVVFTDYQKDEIIKNIQSRFPKMQLEEKTDEIGMKFYILK